MANLDELLKQAENLNRLISEEKAKGKTQGIEQIKNIMAKFDITAEDLGLYQPTQYAPSKRVHKTFPVKRTMPPVEPKYRNPETGQTWSGRGKAPGWLGDNKDEYLIKQDKKAA